jgi:4-amino-4-deoxy-L-arabinose transferase-like glycosyltransferase
MADSLHNFFFVSYDPGGFVTIDKPELGFWLQTLSVKIFGFTPFSIFLPQALAGVLAVLLLYYLVRRQFGFTAGILAALALAVSPISVVTARNNTIDSTLVLVMLLGAWAVIRAAETGKWRWLLLSAVFVGLGFNVKMMEAYLVVPAFGLLYLLCAPRKLPMRLAQLGVAALVLLVVSFAWVATVDMIPAVDRPYVGSTQNNSEISLALGYNGVERLLGQNAGGFGNERETNSTGNASTGRERALPGYGGDTGTRADGFTGRGGGLFGNGSAGPLRLFSAPLGGQIVWLLPFALLAILALAWQRRPQFRTDPDQHAMILWGMWLITMVAFFSVAGFFHSYYMTTLAPAICALFGIGVVVLWQDYRRGGWRAWLLPVALVLTALEQVHIITEDPSWGMWLVPLIIIPCALAAVLLMVMLFLRQLRKLELPPRTLAPALAIALIALLLTPAYWSAMPGITDAAVSIPSAGPGQAGTFGNFGVASATVYASSNTADTALIRYLEANQGRATYLVATASSNQADGIILATNKPVMAMGGFSGSDPILTTGKLAQLVANGTVRFFLVGNGFGGTRRSVDGQPAFDFGARGVSGRGGFGGFGGTQTQLTTWITRNCKAVPTSTWQGSASATGQSSAMQLYDCANAR